MIDKDVIKSQQEKILDSIFETGEKTDLPKLSGLLSEIKSFHPSIVVGTLGSLGQKLLNFAEAVDLRNPHPDILNLCSGALVSDDAGSFSRVVVDILDVKEFCSSNGICSYVSNSLEDVAANHPSWKEVDETIDSPTSNLRNVRFIESRKKRDSIRELKQDQNVGLGPLGKTYGVVEACPSDFASYYRNQNLYARDLKEAKLRIDHMKKFRLDSLAEEVESYIQSLHQKISEETYFGFNQISVPIAAVILGKQMGVNFSLQNNACQVPSVKSTVTAGCADLFFPSEWVERSDLDIEYTPRAYPIHYVWEATSSKTKEVVDHLESFPEIQGKSLFDHYRVVFPSFSFPKREMDVALTSLGYSTAVLLGERDGLNYFICYWESDSDKN